MAALALRLRPGAQACRAAALAGFLHDIGKRPLPLELLHKPSTLTPEEFALIKTHPAHGHALLLQMAETDPVVLEVCRITHPGKLTQPVVKVFHSTKSGLPIPVHALDLAAAHCKDRIAAREPVENGRFPQLHSLWADHLRLPARGSS